MFFGQLCDVWSSCVDRVSADPNSLYAQGIYEAQNANATEYARTYSGHKKLPYIGGGTLVQNIVRLAVFLLVLIAVFLAAQRVFYPLTPISLNLSTFRDSPLTPDFLENLFSRPV